VVPVPLASRRLRTRGFNQAAELARHAAAPAGLRLELQLCMRGRDTAAQMDLPFKERSRNVRGAFGCSRAIPGATVAVVDDVMTTGATLDELAGSLKRAGASRVVNWVLARTSPPEVGP
jgi:predicted amidophosphoribosyltransferase